MVQGRTSGEPVEPDRCTWGVKAGSGVRRKLNVNTINELGTLCSDPLLRIQLTFRVVEEEPSGADPRPLLQLSSTSFGALLGTADGGGGGDVVESSCSKREANDAAYWSPSTPPSGV